MNGFASARGAAWAALRFALMAALLTLAAEASQAAPGGGRWFGGGGRTHGRNADRRDDGRGGRTYARGGDRDRSGDGGRAYRGGSRNDGGGSRVYTYGGGRSYADQGVRIYDGGGRTYGGVRYYPRDTRYHRPYGYRIARPRTYVSLGIGLGLPWYRPPAYRYDVAPPVVVGPGAIIDVTNEPPPGCVYYDRFCDRQFSSLDEYTDHVEQQDHPRTIEIVQAGSDETLRTLAFVDGVWSVEN